MIWRELPTIRIATAALFVGLGLWACGIFSVFGETSVVSSLALLCGVLLTVASALFLLSRRAELNSPDSQLTSEGAMVFCLAFGVGLAALGLALSGAFPVLVRLVFGLGGLALISWSPQAILRFRSER